MSSEVLDDWQEATLGELCQIAIGGTPSRDKPEYWSANGDGHPWVAISDMRDAVILRTKERITDAGVANSNVKPVAAGTVLMSFKLTIGRVAIAGTDLFTNEAIAAFQPTAGIDKSFLPYWLEHIVANAETDQAIKGATLNKKKLAALSGCVPPLDEQRRIAEVLRSVDEAIVAATLVVTQATEAFEALLAELFARYGDASATLESYCLPGGLQTGPFGSQLKAEDYVEDGVPVIMPVDLTPEGMDFSGAKKAPMAKSKELVRHILHPGDVLFARRGEIGRCGLYLENDPVALCGTGCLRARLDTAKVDPALAYFLIQSRQARDWLRAHAVGATMPNLNTTIIGDLPMPDIPMDQQKGWVDALLMIEGTRRINQRTLVSFQRSKSTLMSDLLSGRVRVPA